MWINSIIISIMIASLATNASSNSLVQCEPALEVFWSYDHLNKTSEFGENTDNLKKKFNKFFNDQFIVIN